MVWFIILPAAVLAFALLWKVADLDRSSLTLVAAGLVLAIAGYAWQGRPSLPGKIAVGEVKGENARIGGETFGLLRKPILGQFDRAGSWLTIAESYLSRGDTLNAVAILRSGIREHPDDFDLWIGLGNALQLHAEGALTPAAELAFERAHMLASDNPAPTFFYGQALAQAMRIDEAEAAWRSVLAQLQPDTSWRPLVEQRLQLIDQIRAMAAEQQAAPGPR